VPAGAALVVKPRGTIVEQLSAGDPVERLVARSTGMGAMASETLLKDLLDAIRAAKDDKKIKAIYLDTGDMAGAGLTKLRDLRKALADFKKSGKKVVAYGDSSRSRITASPPRPTVCLPQGAVVSTARALAQLLQGGASTLGAGCTSSAWESTSPRSSPTCGTTCRPRRRRWR
jgi:hypothetical protein